MMIRPKFSLDETRPKATRQFTDREEFIEVFQKALQGIKTGEHNACVFYGVGGIGKTSLRKELGRLLDKERPKTVWAVLDFSVSHYREQETALFTLRRALGEKYKIPFPSFDLAYAVYWQKTHPQTALTKENFPLLDAGGIVTDIVGLFGVIPGIGLIPKVSKLVIKGKKALEDWWTKRGNKELYDLPQLEPKDILERLPMFWASDLKDSLEQKDAQAILFIDTYEALWGKERTEGTVFKRDEWVRELVAQLPGILWIICGREKLRWEEVEGDWGKALNQHLLGGLADEDAKHFLKSCGIEDNAIQRVIIESSKGVPYSLDLAVDTYFEIKSRHRREPQPTDFAHAHQEIIEQFLRYLDRSEIETLKVLSVSRKWDKSIFELLVTQFKTGYPATALKELCRFSFINQGDVPGTWTMHDLMRENLQERIEPESQKAIHRTLFDYYDKELKEIDIKNITGKQKSALTEAFYHSTNAIGVLEVFNWFMGIADGFYKAEQCTILVPMYEKIIEMIETQMGLRQPQVVKALNNLSSINSCLGKYEAAESQCKKALTIAKEALAENDPEYAQTLTILGLVNSVLGKDDEAEMHLNQAFQIIEKTLSPNYPEMARILWTKVTVYISQGKYNEAEPICKKALDIAQNSLGQEHLYTAALLGELAWIYYFKGNYSEADKLHRKALAVSEKIFGPNHPSVARILNGLADLYRDQGKYDEAELHYKRALEIVELNFGESHPSVATYLNGLADLYKAQGKFGEAEIQYKRALEIRELRLGENHPAVKSILKDIIDLYNKCGNHEEAEKFEERLKELNQV